MKYYNLQLVSRMQLAGLPFWYIGYMAVSRGFHNVTIIKQFEFIVSPYAGTNVKKR